MPPKKEKVAFEDAILNLEDIVRKLEKGEASLDESLKLFEEGCKLTSLCSEILDKAEQKVLLYSKETDKQEEMS